MNAKVAGEEGIRKKQKIKVKLGKHEGPNDVCVEKADS